MEAQGLTTLGWCRNQMNDKRQQNRDKHPDLAKFIDECRKYFGNQVKVIELKERKDELPNSKSTAI